MSLIVKAFGGLGNDSHGDTIRALPPGCRQLRRLAVVGRLSPAPGGGRPAARSRADPVITPLVDLCLAVLPGTDVAFHDGIDPEAAVAACVGADAVVVVVEVTPRQRAQAADILTGGGGETRLSLSAAEERLVDAVSAAHPRTVVAVVAGSAVLLHRRWGASTAPGVDPAETPH
jgi:hypothetical protein